MKVNNKKGSIELLQVKVSDTTMLKKDIMPVTKDPQHLKDNRHHL